MLSSKSLRFKFSIQLALASAMLILIFSAMLYNYTRISIYESVVKSMTNNAKSIVALDYLSPEKLLASFPDPPAGKFWARVEKNIIVTTPKFVKTEEGNKAFLTLYYPYNLKKSLSFKQDITYYRDLANEILVDIIIINATMIFLIIFYALFLSRMLLLPIKSLSKNLKKRNERFLTPIDKSTVPVEFEPLCDSINRLIDRIQTFVLYQKELFVGVAHELKTPLAVMKTKNEVTLLKPRDKEKYIEALTSNNLAINNMNKMISSILEIGRQEGAQFEQGEEKDVILYIKELVKNFNILAKLEKKDIIVNLKPYELFIVIQPTLFSHVMQNFVQNAIKFSKPNGTILIESTLKKNEFIINVIDEGIGIDESKDHFAPFKRYGGKEGAGLGLFLAKGAAQAMGGEVYLKNRTDGITGCIASLILKVDTKRSK